MRYPCYLMCFWRGGGGSKLSSATQCCGSHPLLFLLMWDIASKLPLKHLLKGHERYGGFIPAGGGGRGVDGWVGTVCFAFDSVSQANLYKGIRENHCLLCSTAYGKRCMSWSSARYMRSTEVLWWWIPQYCTFSAACIHTPIIYSVLGRTKGLS